ncbi:MAG: ABC transporter permease subunit [Clostridia bacterium]|nr:ABC transporter permease subunit [Clostridia bacterium]
MFKQLYFGELKKMFSLKTALIFFAIFVFGFIIVGLSFRAIGNLVEIDTVGMQDLSPMQSNRINVSEEETQSRLSVLRTELDRAEAEKAEEGYSYYLSLLNSMDEIYYLKSQIEIYEYIADNELYHTDLYFYDTVLYGVSSLGEQTATPFAVTMLGVFAFLLSIYALIIGSGAYATEMRNGTLKILLLHPISRNQLTLAKLLAMLTILTGAFLVIFICTVCYSYLAYHDPGYTMLFVFNAQSVFQAGYAFPLLLSVMSLLVNTLAYGIMAFFFGTLTRKRVLGFVLPYALDFAAPLVGMAGLSRFWITNVIAFESFFGVGMGLNTGSNFFLSLPLAIVYFGAMIALSFVVFHQRDVA